MRSRVSTISISIPIFVGIAGKYVKFFLKDDVGSKEDLCRRSIIPQAARITVKD
jgi:hypothetical protein